MWWRSFFLQAAWSYEYKQNLGFAWFYGAASPLRPGAPGLAEPFNTNPVTSCFVVPFLKSQESTFASPEDLLRARSFLSSSFAATGDRLVWFLLRPLAGLAGIAVCWLAPPGWPLTLAAAAVVL